MPLSPRNAFAKHTRLTHHSKSSCIRRPPPTAGTQRSAPNSNLDCGKSERHNFICHLEQRSLTSTIQPSRFLFCRTTAPSLLRTHFATCLRSHACELIGEEDVSCIMVHVGISLIENLSPRDAQVIIVEALKNLAWMQGLDTSKFREHDWKCAAELQHEAMAHASRNSRALYGTRPVAAR